MTDSLDARRKRLIHRSLYTGMKETDLLLGVFARAAVPHMSPAELDLYETMLEEVSDPTIYSWIVGRDEPDPRFSFLIDRMRNVPGDN